MSMLSEQIKNLKELADYWKFNGKEPSNALRQAADTIEALSAKLANANMEQSTECYKKTETHEKMTLDEAIDHLNEILQSVKKWDCEECRNEHIQLRKWLLELKRNRERSEAYYGGGWIPCNERLPEKVGNYIIHVKTGTDEDYVGVWCYQRGVHLSGRQTYIDDMQGYWASPYNGDPINKPLSKRVIAWQPLPEPYTKNEK